MSGHITRMSRGSSVGSSSRSPTSTSRSTSTCRAEPWQACTCTESSPRSGPVRPARSAASGAWLARRSCWSHPSSVSAGGGVVAAGLLGRSPSVRRSSRASRPSELSSGCPTTAAEESAERGTCPSRAAGPSASQRAVEAWGSHRCTSRSSPSADSRDTSVSGSRVCPKRESLGGRSRSSPPARRRATVSAWRTSGGATSTTSRSRRHSSACQRRSPSRSPPAPSESRPARHSASRSGRWTA